MSKTQVRPIFKTSKKKEVKYLLLSKSNQIQYNALSPVSITFLFNTQVLQIFKTSKKEVQYLHMSKSNQVQYSAQIPMSNLVNTCFPVLLLFLISIISFKNPVRKLHGAATHSLI